MTSIRGRKDTGIYELRLVCNINKTAMSKLAIFIAGTSEKKMMHYMSAYIFALQNIKSANMINEQIQCGRHVHRETACDIFIIVVINIKPIIILQMTCFLSLSFFSLVKKWREDLIGKSVYYQGFITKKSKKKSRKGRKLKTMYNFSFQLTN